MSSTQSWFYSQPVQAQDNNLAQTPPMGWNSWNRFGCNVSEQLIKETADVMVRNGMRNVGYEYVNIDDCWQVGRDIDGTILPDPVRFPSGMAALADYVHARGLKLGIYTDAGTHTCQGRPGSLGYEQQDVQTYATWGVDYIKVDWCYSEGLDARTQYALWRDVLAEVDRPIIFSISTGGLNAPWAWGPETGHLWRTTYDIEDNWQRILEILDFNVNLAAYAKPGSWNDPDMLEVGNGGMTDEEYQSHFSLWAIMAAPLIAGNDLRNMSITTQAILTNPEVIGVNQDTAGIQGTRVHSSNGLEVWSKPLQGSGERSVALFNRNDSNAEISVEWHDIGLASGAAAVRNLWEHTDLGVFTNRFTAQVPAHGVVMIKVVSDETAVTLPGEIYLSDLAWNYALNGWGSVERDRSNGEQMAGDGDVITLNSITYAKGLGMRAAARVHYTLDGKCSSLITDIGVDDAVGEKGSVEFEVWTDGLKRYNSGIMTGSSATKQIQLDITSTAELILVLNDGGDDNNFDYAAWADSRVICKTQRRQVYFPLIRSSSPDPNFPVVGRRAETDNPPYHSRKDHFPSSWERQAKMKKFRKIFAVSATSIISLWFISLKIRGLGLGSANHSENFNPATDVSTVKKEKS